MVVGGGGRGEGGETRGGGGETGGGGGEERVAEEETKNYGSGEG